MTEVRYLDDAQELHSILCISDMEQSLTQSTETYFNQELLFSIFEKALPGFQIPEITNQALYVFNGKNKDLEYDGIYHITCSVTSIF